MQVLTHFYTEKSK